jgi:hypothetical protein
MPVAVGALLVGFVAAGPAGADTPSAPVGSPIYGFGGLCLDVCAGRTRPSASDRAKVTCGGAGQSGFGVGVEGFRGA